MKFAPLFLLALCVAPSSSIAQDTRFEIGVRGLVILGEGSPANDMLGAGLIGRMHWKRDWCFGLSLDSVTFDYERPYDALGTPSLAEIDGTNDFSRIAVWLEQRKPLSDRIWDWSWAVGIGIASVDAEIVRGATPSGSAYDIETRAADEVHLLANIGLRRRFASSWVFDATLGLEHHTTDYRLVDRVSGRTGSIRGHTPVGLSFGIGYRF